MDVVIEPRRIIRRSVLYAAQNGQDIYAAVAEGLAEFMQKYQEKPGAIVLHMSYNNSGFNAVDLNGEVIEVLYEDRGYPNWFWLIFKEMK